MGIVYSQMIQRIILFSQLSKLNKGQDVPSNKITASQTADGGDDKPKFIEISIEYTHESH